MNETTNEVATKEQLDEFTNFFEGKYTINDKGNIKINGKNRYVQPLDVYYEYNELMNLLKKKGLSREEVLKAIECMKDTNNPEQPKVDLKTYIIKVLGESKEFKIDPSFSQIWFRAEGQEFYQNSSLEELFDHFKAIKEDDPVLKPYSIGAIESWIKKIAASARNLAQNKLISKIKYDEKYEKDVDPFLKSIYDFFQIKQSFPVFRMMMCHWAWQVKRKMTNRDVVWHIWINFNGPSKIGKSWMVRHIAKPFEGFYLEAPIRIIFDDTKEVMKMTNNYIINFEELAVNKERSPFGGGDGTLSKDEISTMKSIVTGEKLDTRIYGKQAQMKRDITFSCISTANEHLYDVFFDETTMRRYFEFDCQRTVPGTDEERAELNKHLDDSLKFWKGIDDNRDRGYWEESSKLGKEVFDAQSSYYPTKGPIVEMAKYFDFVKSPTTPTCDSYNTFHDWCRSAGYKFIKSLPSFNAEVAKRFPECIGSDGLPHICFVSKNGDSTESFSDLIKNNRDVPEDF